MIRQIKVLVNYKKIKLIGIFNKYNQKERVVIAISMILLSVGLFYALVISYYSNKLKQTNIEKMNAQANLLAKKEYMMNVNKILKEPDTPKNIETIEILKNKQEQLMEQLRELNKTSYSSAELSDLLYNLLLDIKTLKIVSFVSQEESMTDANKNLQTQGANNIKKQTSPLSAAQQKLTKPLGNKEQAKSGIVNPGSSSAKNTNYSNRIEIAQNHIGANSGEPSLNSNWFGPIKQNYTLTLEGKYLDIYKYLSLIESKSLPIYWESLDYKVKKAPLAVVDIKFYSFSTRNMP